MATADEEKKAYEQKVAELAKQIKFSEAVLSDLRQSFDEIDTDKTGTITAGELQDSLKAVGFIPSDGQLKEIMSSMDKDKDGTISFEEYVQVAKESVVEVQAAAAAAQTAYQEQLETIAKQIEFTEEQLAEIKKSFDEFDADKTGSISTANMKEALKSAGRDPTDDDIKKIMEQMDFDQNGSISLEEFVRVAKEDLAQQLLMMSLASQRMRVVVQFSEEEMASMKAMFDNFDKDTDGFITLDELKECGTAVAPGKAVGDDEAKALMDKFDLDKDGKISFDEFVNAHAEMMLAGA